MVALVWNGRSRSLPRAVREWVDIITWSKERDNTKKATKVALNVFRDYLKERKIDEDSLAASKDKLATVLRKFCAETRKKNGEFYTKASLVGIRFGLQRFLSSRKIDIIKDPEFSEANKVYHAEISELKREGRAQTQYKPAINKHYIKKLYESGLFNLTQPEILQNKVFFFSFFFPKACFSSAEEDART